MLNKQYVDYTGIHRFHSRAIATAVASEAGYIQAAGLAERGVTYYSKSDGAYTPVEVEPETTDVGSYYIKIDEGNLNSRTTAPSIRAMVDYVGATTDTLVSAWNDSLNSKADITALAEIRGDLAGKVDKEDGKVLSTNDFTDVLKNTVQTNADARHSHANKSVLDGITVDDIAKWSSGQANVITSVKVNGEAVSITDKAVDIAVPTDNKDLTNGAGYIKASEASDLYQPKETGKGLSEVNFTEALKGSYDGAVSKAHEHTNLTALNSITAAKITTWDKAEANVITSVKVNGEAVSPAADRSVNITFPAAPGIANASTAGLVKSSTTGTTSGRDYAVEVDSSTGTMKVNVPWTDTVYTHPDTHSAAIITTDSTHRFITDEQLTKLDNLSTSDIRALANTWSQKQTYSAAGSVDSSSSVGAGAINVSSGGIVASGGIKGNKVYNAVWNDLADCIPVDDSCTLEPGRCYVFDGERYMKSSKYLDDGIIGIHSDTYGMHMGSKEGVKQMDVAVAGFVLAYVDRVYRPGTPLTCGPDGTLTEILKQDKIEWPEKVVAVFWKDEPADEWGDADNKVRVDGRKWVKVR